MNGYLDCDDPDVIDYVQMADMLDYMRDHSDMPPLTFRSWQEEVFPGRSDNAVEAVNIDAIKTTPEEISKSSSSDAKLNFAAASASR